MKCVFTDRPGTCGVWRCPFAKLPWTEVGSPPGAEKVAAWREEGVRLELVRHADPLWVADMGRGWTYQLYPVTPFSDDDIGKLEQELQTVVSGGCDHIVAGLDPVALEKVGGDEDYRFRIYYLLRCLCDLYGVSFTPLDRDFAALVSCHPCCRAIRFPGSGK